MTLVPGKLYKVTRTSRTTFGMGIAAYDKLLVETSSLIFLPWIEPNEIIVMFLEDVLFPPSRFVTELSSNKGYKCLWKNRIVYFWLTDPNAFEEIKEKKE